MKTKLILFYHYLNNDCNAYVINISKLKPEILVSGICSSENFVKSDYGYKSHPLEVHQYTFEAKIKIYDQLFGVDNWEIEYWGNILELQNPEKISFIYNLSSDFENHLQMQYYIPNKYWFITYRKNNIIKNKILDNIHPFQYLRDLNVEVLKDKEFVEYVLCSFQEITKEEFQLNLDLLNSSSLNTCIPIHYNK